MERQSAAYVPADPVDARTGFLVESPGGRVGVVVGVRSIKAGRRRVEALIVSAGESLNRVLIIPVSEIREVLPARRRLVLCASPRMISTEHVDQTRAGMSTTA